MVGVQVHFIAVLIVLALIRVHVCIFRRSPERAQIYNTADKMQQLISRLLNTYFVS